MTEPESLVVPVITLTTQPTRHHVNIDGQLYPLRSQEALTIRELHRMEQYRARLVPLATRTDLSEAEEAGIDEAIRGLCALAVPDVPAATLEALGHQGRSALASLFLNSTIRPDRHG